MWIELTNALGATCPMLAKKSIITAMAERTDAAATQCSPRIVSTGAVQGW